MHKVWQSVGNAIGNNVIFSCMNASFLWLYVCFLLIFENEHLRKWSKTYLPSGGVSPEVAKSGRKPIVNLVQCQLSFVRLNDCLFSKCL